MSFDARKFYFNDIISKIQLMQQDRNYKFTAAGYSKELTIEYSEEKYEQTNEGYS